MRFYWIIARISLTSVLVTFPASGFAEIATGKATMKDDRIDIRIRFGEAIDNLYWSYNFLAGELVVETKGGIQYHYVNKTYAMSMITGGGEFDLLEGEVNLRSVEKYENLVFLRSKQRAEGRPGVMAKPDRPLAELLKDEDARLLVTLYFQEPKLTRRALQIELAKKTE